MGAMQNAQKEEFIGPRSLINRNEYIRLLEQALVHLGYPDLASRLEQESGIEMQPRVASEFRAAVMSGDFQGALDVLPRLGTSAESIQRARFLLLSQKYTEAISSGNYPAALHCLRHELQPLEDTCGGAVLPGLAAMLLSGAPGSANGSAPPAPRGRESLLAELQALLPPSVLMPEARLQELVEQALLAQLERCPYHNARTLRMCLFVDYVAGPEQLPTETSQILDAHTDEVWGVHFSLDGRWLVTFSKDGSALLYSVAESGDVALSRHLLVGNDPVNLATFSPDGGHILVGAHDGKLRVYSLPGGHLRMEIQVTGRSETISSANWAPDGRHVIVTAGMELRVLDLEHGGAVVDKLVLGHHSYDAVLSKDGSTCVIAGSDKERRLRFTRLSDRKEAWAKPARQSLTSLNASPDGRFVAATLNSGTIHIWPLGDLGAPTAAAPAGARPGSNDPLDALPSEPLRELQVPGEGNPGRFVIRSSFGGAGCSFIASGSEGRQVHIWHRESGELLASLDGHASTVNAVSWNPRNVYMLASASDDHTVRIWVAPAAGHWDARMEKPDR